MKNSFPMYITFRFELVSIRIVRKRGHGERGRKSEKQRTESTMQLNDKS